MTDDPHEVCARLTAFVSGQLDPDRAKALTAGSPLREWGVLNSLGMARLLAFIRAELGVAVPARALTGGDVGTIEDIAALVVALAPRG